MTSDSPDRMNRASQIKELLVSLTEGRGHVFDCAEVDLQKANFETISEQDLVAESKDVQRKIDALLKTRAVIQVRLKVAERLLRKISRNENDN